MTRLPVSRYPSIVTSLQSATQKTKEAFHSCISSSSKQTNKQPTALLNYSQTHLLNEHRHRFGSNQATCLLRNTSQSVSHAHVNHAQLPNCQIKTQSQVLQPLFRGRVRMQVPSTRNYTPKLPTFVVIARVNPVQVQ